MRVRQGVSHTKTHTHTPHETRHNTSLRMCGLSFVMDGSRLWRLGGGAPRSAAELKEAATHYDRAAALSPAPAGKASLAGVADWCRSVADAI